jgi:hypothetical protein
MSVPCAEKEENTDKKDDHRLALVKTTTAFFEVLVIPIMMVV